MTYHIVADVIERTTRTATGVGVSPHMFRTATASSAEALLVAFDPLLPIGIGLDQARIDCKSFITNQLLLDAAAQHALEHATKEVTLPEAAMPVFGKRRVIRHRPIQT
jgi:hypothetical protein